VLWSPSITLIKRCADEKLGPIGATPFILPSLSTFRKRPNIAPDISL